MNRGYIKFWRKAEDSSSWNRGLIYQGLIINLLSRAAWKKGSYQGRTLLPGQIGTVMSQLAKELGLARSTLQRMIAHLETDEFLKIENVGNRFVIITIVNWHSYQVSEKENGQLLPSGQPMVNHDRGNRATEWATDGRSKANVQLENSHIDSSSAGNRLVNQWATDGRPHGQPSYKEEEVKKERIEEEEKKVSKGVRKPKPKLPSYDEMVSAYTRNQDLKQALSEFIVMRKAAKSPFTNAALEHTFRELDKHAGAEDAVKIAMLNQSVQRGWMGVFPLKETYESLAPAGPPRPMTYREREREDAKEITRIALRGYGVDIDAINQCTCDATVDVW